MRIEQAQNRSPWGKRASYAGSIILHLLLLLLFAKLAERALKAGPILVSFNVVDTKKEEPPPPPKPEKKLWPEPPKDVRMPQQNQIQEAKQDTKRYIPDEEINRLLPKGAPRELDDFRPNIATLRREDGDLPGMRVSGVKRSDDGSSNMRGAFFGVDRKKDVDIPNDGLPPHFGKGNKGIRGGVEGGTGEGSGMRNYFKSGPRQDSTLESAPLFKKPAEKKEPIATDIVSDSHGTWRKIENVGPLAHLNARCYEVPSGQVVYYQEYKLRCSDNQIIEAWRKQ